MERTSNVEMIAHVRAEGERGENVHELERVDTRPILTTVFDDYNVPQKLFRYDD